MLGETSPIAVLILASKLFSPDRGGSILSRSDDEKSEETLVTDSMDERGKASRAYAWNCSCHGISWHVTIAGG
jgi:hypothetical protein